MRLCISIWGSVRPSVAWSVRPSIRRLVTLSSKMGISMMFIECPIEGQKKIFVMLGKTSPSSKHRSYFRQGRKITRVLSFERLSDWILVSNYSLEKPLVQDILIIWWFDKNSNFHIFIIITNTELICESNFSEFSLFFI